MSYQKKNKESDTRAVSGIGGLMEKSLPLHIACILTGLWKTQIAIRETEDMAIDQERKERRIKLLQMSQLRAGYKLLLAFIGVAVPVLKILGWGVGVFSFILLAGESDTLSSFFLSKVYALIGLGLTFLCWFIRTAIEKDRIGYEKAYYEIISWFVKNCPDLI